MNVTEKKYKVQCCHCGYFFDASYRQMIRNKNQGTETYCSTLCRTTKQSKKKEVPAKKYGPCPTCGEFFYSKRKKTFCSIDCYTKSDQFRAHLSANAQKGRDKASKKAKIEREMSGKKAGGKVAHVCKNCEKVFFATPKSGRKFCTRSCYREFQSSLFDKWIANPEQIALPQCFDEFFTQEELPCLIDGCYWKGHHLGVHLNQAHGISAAEFKRAVGFNLSSGLVSPSLREKLIINNADKGSTDRLLANKISRQGITQYVSLEAREHRKKFYAVLREEYKNNGEKEEIVCKYCGETFLKSDPISKQEYCNVGCRNKWNNRKHVKMKCADCGEFFLGDHNQFRRLTKKLPVFCSMLCRGRHNGRLSKRR